MRNSQLIDYNFVNLDSLSFYKYDSAHYHRYIRPHDSWGPAKREANPCDDAYLFSDHSMTNCTVNFPD